MAGTLNKVMLIGHTGDDVKMHYFEGGGAIGRFPLATNDSYTNKSTGERVENTEWHNIVVRNKAAEVCEKYLKKGDKVYIEGRLRTRKWVDDKGMDRYSTEIQCTEFVFLPSGRQEGAGPGQGNQPQNTQGRDNSQSQPENNWQNKSQQESPDLPQEDEDDLPF